MHLLVTPPHPCPTRPPLTIPTFLFSCIFIRTTPYLKFYLLHWVFSPCQSECKFYKLTLSDPFKARVSLASLGFAGSMPSSLTLLTIFSTCSALLLAMRPVSKQRLSSERTRVFFPSGGPLYTISSDDDRQHAPTRLRPLWFVLPLYGI